MIVVSKKKMKRFEHMNTLSWVEPPYILAQSWKSRFEPRMPLPLNPNGLPQSLGQRLTSYETLSVPSLAQGGLGYAYSGYGRKRLVYNGICLTIHLIQ
jgi:hypothetical protein